MKKIELGISTFGETTPLASTNQPISHGERIRNLIEEIQTADAVGLDVYGVGEHHRSDFAVSSPEMILAAAASVTKQIKLTSAVSVLSSYDPVRLYQNFAHLDALSHSRAEIMVGRGSFTESFPLFGYDLKDYQQLFQEKLALLSHIKQHEIVDWKGTLTQNIDHLGIYPRAQKLPIWVATGGNVESTIAIGELGLPIVYAIIGGNPLSFKPLIQAYKTVGKEAGHNLDQLKVGAHSWGYIADSDQLAANEFFWPTKQLVDHIAKTRPSWRELSREAYDNMISDHGAVIVGSPTTVAQKIIKLIEALDLDRFFLHLPTGSMEHHQVLHAIKLYGEVVAPIVRQHFANK